MEIVFAKDLRDKERLKMIPNNIPGWYRWWASEDALKLLLNSKYITNEYLDDIMPFLETKMIENKKYFYIYVGIAVKESIRDRLNWHVNQKHAKSSVVSGFLSTLRQSISSLVAGNQYEEVATNDLIDMLVIEYFPVDLPIKSDEAKEYIEDIENKELANNVLPLNLKGNKNPILKDYLRELKSARKNSK